MAEPEVKKGRAKADARVMEHQRQKAEQGTQIQNQMDSVRAQAKADLKVEAPRDKPKTAPTVA